MQNTDNLSIATIEKDDGDFIVTLNGLPGWKFRQYELPARPAIPHVGLPATPAKVLVNVIKDGGSQFSFGCESWVEAIDFAKKGGRI